LRMTIWKRAGFYTFGWAARVVVTLWLSTCRVSEFGRKIETRYLKANPGKGLLYASWHRGLFFAIYWYRNQNVVSILRPVAGDRHFAKWKIISIKDIKAAWWPMPPGGPDLSPSWESSI